MRKTWVLFVAGLALAACQRGCGRNKDSGHVAEPGAGQAPRVTFVIDKVYEKQQPTSSAPWHGAGGNWTFFDAHTDAGARFGFGFTHKPGKESFAFGKAMWTVPDPNMGAQLISSFARVFDAKVPLPTPQHDLHPLPFSLAVLGDHIGRNDDGFSGSGDWIATKLFLQRTGLEAEIFFNFNLADKAGEFAQKDSEYAEDLVLFMARELRDGPLPPQTPENDARISLVGPKLGEFRPLAPPDATFQSFEAKGSRLIYSVKDGPGTKLVSVALEGPPQELELLRVENDLSDVSCAPSDDPCLVQGVKHKEPNTFSGSDPTQLLLVQRAAKKVVPLVGPWGEHGSTTRASVSPDGKYVAIASMRERKTRKGWFHSLNFVSVDEPTKQVPYEHGEDWLDVVAWRGSDAELRAVVRTGQSFDREQIPTWFLVDPRSATEIALPAADLALPDETVSPDGKLRYSCNKDQEVLITELATGTVRRFPIDARERHAFKEGCDLGWRGSRFLEFSPERTAFIDLESMKLSFPFPQDEAENADPINPQYDPTFTWAAFTQGKRLGVARIDVR
jgi:hypothetical protein